MSQGELSIRRRRSALYVPASNAKAIAKARELACDVVILDLEDAVAPDAKLAARGLAVAALREGGFGEREVVVRVNALGTEWGTEDLAAFKNATMDAILLPKINSCTDIAAYSQALAGVATPLWAMVETAISVFHLNEIAAAAKDGRLAAFVMGTNDLAKEMGAQPGVMRTPFLGILGLAVAAARAHRMVILDGVFNDLEDSEGFSAQTRQAVEFGFDGKTLIHPRQIELCNAAFTPDEAAVAWAQRIVAAYDDPLNASKGAIRLDGKMVERLHLQQARRTLAGAGLE